MMVEAEVTERRAGVLRHLERRHGVSASLPQCSSDTTRHDVVVIVPA